MSPREGAAPHLAPQASANLKAMPLDEIVECVQRTAERMQKRLRDEGRTGTLNRGSRRGGSRRDVENRVSERIAANRESLLEASMEDADAAGDNGRGGGRGKPRSRTRSGSSGDSERQSQSQRWSHRLSPPHNEDVWRHIGNFLLGRRNKAQQQRLTRADSSGSARGGGVRDSKGRAVAFVRQSLLHQQAPKYATLRPVRKIFSRSPEQQQRERQLRFQQQEQRFATAEHAGPVRQSGPIFLQGVRVNSWHLFWYQLRYTGLELFASRGDMESARRAVLDVFCRDLVLPTGRVVDVLEGAGWRQRNKHAFCLHTERETFCFATESRADLIAFVQAMEAAYAEFMERQIRRRVMMQIAWSFSDDPETFVREQAAELAREAAAAGGGIRGALNRAAGSRASRSRSSALRAAGSGAARGSGAKRPNARVTRKAAQDVLGEMLQALDDKLELELELIVQRRTLARLLLRWRAAALFAKTRRDAAAL